MTTPTNIYYNPCVEMPTEECKDHPKCYYSTGHNKCKNKCKARITRAQCE